MDHRRSRSVARSLRGHDARPCVRRRLRRPRARSTCCPPARCRTCSQQQIGPAFQEATGYTLNDTSMGSDAIANGIKGGTLQGDVFISASPAVNQTLEGSANGNWVSWYADVRLVAAGAGLQPVEQVRRGTQDQAVVRRHRPARLPDRSDRPHDRPQGRPGRHGSRPGGQDAPHPGPEGHRVIDVERVPRDLTRRAAPGRAARCRVLLRRRGGGGRHQDGAADGTRLAGDYTITVLNQAPHDAAARAFVAFLLGKAGQQDPGEERHRRDQPRPR